MATQEEFYQELDELGEDEVVRRHKLKTWTNSTHVIWVESWLEKKKRDREERVIRATEDSAQAAKDSASTARSANFIAAIAIIISIAAFVWSVWGP